MNLRRSGHHAKVDHAQRHVQHVHSRQAKKRAGKLRHRLGDVGKFAHGLLARKLWETFGSESPSEIKLLHSPSMKNDETRAAKPSSQATIGAAIWRRHGNRRPGLPSPWFSGARKEKRGHDRGN